MSPESVNRGRRIKWVDLARSIAIMCVVFCHAIEHAYHLTPQTITTMSDSSKLIALTGFSIGRLGVPLFLFITGYLLLDRQYDSKKCITFWKQKWLPLLACSEAWILIYNAFLAFQGFAIQPQDLIKQMLFLESVEMEHFWYIPMILGIYLFIPIMAMGLQKLSWKTVAIPTAFLFGFAFVVPVVNVFLNTLKIEPLIIQIDFGYSGAVYGIYVLAGWMVKKGALQHAKRSILAICGLAFLACLIGLQVWTALAGSGYATWYNNALLLCSGLALFGFISHAKTVPFYAFFKSIARYSFPIFLIHLMIIGPLSAQIAPLHIPHIIKAAILFFAGFGMSYVIARLVELIPVVGKRILHLK